VKTVAALYVATGGCYFGLEGVDPWDEARDARLYAGPWPVVAHPPCQRWGRYYDGGPEWRKQGKPPKEKGDDNGCFAAALTSVRRWGGVIEHPEGSFAWASFGIPAPPRSGGWIADGIGGWVCSVSQGFYGHRAAKQTWLYLFGVERPPPLRWGKPHHMGIRDITGMSEAERKREIRTGACQRMGHRERLATPIPFRDLLLALARSVGGAA
jgi:hypothetical protein